MTSTRKVLQGGSISCGGRRKRRYAISLLEVIACTAIVAVMIVPIAGVIRASSQSIATATGNTSVQAGLRTGLRWVASTVRDSDILAVNTRRLTLRLSDSSVARIEVRRGNLVLLRGNDETVLVDGVREVQFRAINRVTPPIAQTGLAISLRAQDAASGQWVTVNSTIAVPPQV